MIKLEDLITGLNDEDCAAIESVWRDVHNRDPFLDPNNPDWHIAVALIWLSREVVKLRAEVRALKGNER